jgi:hypothetical protein
MLLSPLDVLKKGFTAAGLPDVTHWTERRTEEFRSHDGSSPVVLANIWYDLTTTNIDTGLTENDKSPVGFKMFLIAHHFLWAYPKNSKMLASRFRICERNVRGEPLWRWLRMIAALKAKKIVWDKSLDDPKSQVFILTVDGTDYKVWEKSTLILRLIKSSTPKSTTTALSNTKLPLMCTVRKSSGLVALTGVENTTELFLQKACRPRSDLVSWSLLTESTVRRLRLTNMPSWLYQTQWIAKFLPTLKLEPGAAMKRSMGV